MDTASDAIRTSVSDTASSTAIIAATAVGGKREGLIIHNNSSSILYVAFGGTAASIAAGGYTYKIPADAHWEMNIPIFQGAIWGIWSADSTGYASITELV